MGILSRNQTEYNRVYGGFRGVDFSSDATQVNESRFSYLVNMFKDYQSEQGEAVETMVGFRRRLDLGAPIYGIHELKEIFAGETTDRILIHAGNRLYIWDTFPNSVNAEEKIEVQLYTTETEDDTFYYFRDIDTEFPISYVVGADDVFGNDLVVDTDGFEGSVELPVEGGEEGETETVAFNGYIVSGGMITDEYYDKFGKVILTYKYPMLSPVKGSDGNAIVMNELESRSFVFNNRLYILDGKNIFVFGQFDGQYLVKNAADIAYVPTVYISGDGESFGTEYEQRNMLTPLYKQSFIADGTTTEFNIASPTGTVTGVEVYGSPKVLDTDYTVSYATDGEGAPRLVLDDGYAADESNAGTYILCDRQERTYEHEFVVGAGWASHFSRHIRASDGCFVGELGEMYRTREDGTGYITSGHSASIQTDPLGGTNELYIECKTAKKGDVLHVKYAEYKVIGVISQGTVNYALPAGKNESNLGTVCTGGGTHAWDASSGAIAYTSAVSVLDKAFYTVTKPGYKIVFTSAPIPPDQKGYPEGYAGITVTMSDPVSNISGIQSADASDNTDAKSIVSECTIAEVFDQRVFLSGNPRYPNHIFWCGRNKTGYADATYFGILNYQVDGTGNAPIKGMLRVGDALMVLKEESQTDGTVYYHTPNVTGNDIATVTYPSTQGLPTIGCYGACVNFLDDPVFVSKLGLEAIGNLNLNNERLLEHRSSLIDAKFRNSDLRKASFVEWNGYLMILVSGQIFMADSRQRFTNEKTGNIEYEWYYLEDIGVYEGQYEAFRYAYLPDELAGKFVCVEENGTPNYYPIKQGKNVRSYANRYENNVLHGNVYTRTETEPYMYSYTESAEQIDFVIDGCDALYVTADGSYTGGEFDPATNLFSVGENIYFGTLSGKICMFNFDMRGEDGKFPSEAYTYDGRTIVCGVATKMDNCNIPHLTKNTIKKSTVVKMKTMARSSAKIKVRTNRKEYTQIDEVSAAIFDFNDMDFDDVSFITTDQTLFAVREKEKKWVEKQFYVFSDVFRHPFSLYYIAFRYVVAGRYK